MKMNPSLSDPKKYISVTLEFRCNLKCNHCMIEGTMDHLKPTDEIIFESILLEQKQTNRWDGIILTGSEITLNRNLPHMSKAARDHGFRYVRIQTHGMHLFNKTYLEKIMDAGVNEFFISVAGASRETHDKITKIHGSFEKMIKGIELIEASSRAVIITNTVVTQESYKDLKSIVSLLSDMKSVVQHEFWNYFPMSKVDDKELVVPYEELMPYIYEAIQESDTIGKLVEVKNIPECLLKNWRSKLVNEQPKLFIDPKFWEEFDKNDFNQCVYRDQCISEQCLGLTSAYIEKFGYEENLLSPIRIPY